MMFREQTTDHCLAGALVAIWFLLVAIHFLQHWIGG